MKKAFDLKSARMDTLAIYLNQTEQAALAQELAERAKSMTAWQGMALLLDLQAFSSPNELALAEILALFREAGLPIRALRHQDEAWLQVALAHGLAFCQPDGYRETFIMPEPPAAQAEPIVPKPLPLEDVRKTMVVERPIRTGQQVYAENADLIVLGMVSEGAEVIADGHVHIYAPLRGRALAGAEGDQEARIFVQSMQAQLVSVAGIYRTFEQALPAHLQRQAVQIYLHEGRLVISAFSQ